MKKFRVSPARRRALLAASALSLALGATLLPATMPVAQAAPKRVLELWPGQRVLLVLPFTVGPYWNGGPELAEAVKPLIRPELQNALVDTNKFSVTLPYRFDPILRRAVADNRISQDIITAFVDTPSLETAAPVFTQLTFEQVPMVAQIQLEEIRVGGTEKKPTVQLQVSGKLYEIGGGAPFRSVVVTSSPAEGRTPEERLQRAAANAFAELAARFVEAPSTFDLPLSLDNSRDAANADAMGADAMNTDKMDDSAATPVTPAVPATPPAPPATVPTMQPNPLAPRPGVPVVPALPPGEPPLGVNATGEKALGR